MQKDIWRLQSQAQTLLLHEPVASCMRQFDQRFPDPNVTITYSSEEQQAYYGHLKICGLVWHCPVCASIIIRYRRHELTDVLTYWREKGGSVLLVTLATSSQKDTALATLLSPLETVFRQERQGRAAQKMKADFGIHGAITTREISYTASGWRPCIRQLILFDETRQASFEQGSPFLEEDCPLLGDSPNQKNIRSVYRTILQRRWQQVINGTRCTDHEFHLSLEDDFTKIYNSFKHIGDEFLDNSPMHDTTQNDFDREITPFALLDFVAQGTREFEALFREYAECYKGKRFVVWLKGLRSLVGSRAGLSGYFQGKADSEVVSEQINTSARKLLRLFEN